MLVPEAVHRIVFKAVSYHAFLCMSVAYCHMGQALCDACQEETTPSVISSPACFA
jgi:hypothetical protein